MKTIPAKNLETITNTPAYLHTWLIRGIGVAGLLFFSYEFYQVLVQSSDGLPPAAIMLGLLLAALAFLSLRSFNAYSGVATLYMSDWGVHSRKGAAEWKQVQEMYVRTQLGIPILFIEYKDTNSSSADPDILKTTLDKFGGSATHTLEKLRERKEKYSND